MLSTTYYGDTYLLWLCLLLGATHNQLATTLTATLTFANTNSTHHSLLLTASEYLSPPPTPLLLAAGACLISIRLLTMALLTTAMLTMANLLWLYLLWQVQAAAREMLDLDPSRLRRGERSRAIASLPMLRGQALLTMY